MAQCRCAQWCIVGDPVRRRHPLLRVAWPYPHRHQRNPRRPTALRAAWCRSPPCAPSLSGPAIRHGNADISLRCFNRSALKLTRFCQVPIRPSLPWFLIPSALENRRFRPHAAPPRPSCRMTSLKSVPGLDVRLTRRVPRDSAQSDVVGTPINCSTAATTPSKGWSMEMVTASSGPGTSNTANCESSKVVGM